MIISNFIIPKLDSYKCVVSLDNVYIYINSVVEEYGFFHVVQKGSHYITNNASISKKLKKNCNIENQITGDFNYGYFLKINTREQEIIFKNDMYGVYPLYYYFDKKFILSDDYLIIFKSLANTEVNKDALFDLILFNKMLGDKTLTKQIKRIKPSTEIKYIKNTIALKNQSDILGKIKSLEYQGKIGQSINESIIDNLNINKEIILTLSGGFDTRALFSIMLDSELTFKTLTWGQAGSREMLLTKSLSKKFNIKHIELILNNSYIKNLENYIERFIGKNLGNPLILDTIHYEYMNERISDKNVITGFCGSEIIRGLSLFGYQTFFTYPAFWLLSLKDEMKVSSLLKKYILNLNCFTNDFEDCFYDYLHSLFEYRELYSLLSIEEKFLIYILYEIYPKYFGTIINTLYNNNVINPFMHIGFISKYLEKQKKFNKVQTNKYNAYQRFSTYKFYSDLIRATTPELLHTSSDRGYSLHHLQNSRFDKVMIEIVKNKKNSINYPKTIDYSLWMKNKIIKEENFSHLTNEIKFFNDVSDSNNLNTQNSRKLIIMYGLEKYFKVLKNYP
ncbi:MAG: hypothetical protein JXA99_17150 [Candidatus Lokiarchaeota archaeon]|nr:hypothetical protein [Candidatus Lokiarchaeota archaeon]